MSDKEGQKPSSGTTRAQDPASKPATSDPSKGKYLDPSRISVNVRRPTEVGGGKRKPKG
jgi:hypothetical protein